jgi:hypothetical protein
MNTEIKDRQKSIEFILAGNSTVTFLNSMTGNRFTFKVKKSDKSDLYFVSVLTSPDIFTYIGIIIPSGFSYSKKSTINQNAQSVQVFKYVYSNLVRNKLPEYIQIWHEGKCGRCNRTLTVPGSIITGIGPECSKKMNIDKREINLKYILEKV